QLSSVQYPIGVRALPRPLSVPRIVRDIQSHVKKAHTPFGAANLADFFERLSRENGPRFLLGPAPAASLPLAPAPVRVLPRRRQSGHLERASPGPPPTPADDPAPTAGATTSGTARRRAERAPRPVVCESRPDEGRRGRRLPPPRLGADNARASDPTNRCRLHEHQLAPSVSQPDRCRCPVQ